MATKKKSLKERTRTLRFEDLEDRTLLAGDVAVDLLPDGTLQIVGDHSGNGIAVTSPTPDVIEVAGTGDTTINGSQKVLIPVADLVDLVIEMEHGDDEVRVREVELSGDMHVDLGGWNNSDTRDVVSIDRTGIGGDLVVQGQQGRQQIALSSMMVGGDLLVDTGTGTDETFIQGATVAGDAVIQGQGSGVVLLTSLNVANDLAISLGNSGSDLKLQSLKTGGDLSIVTGSGDDNVWTNGIDVAGDLEIDTGQGSDSVRFGSIEYVSGSVTVETGEGKDSVVFDYGILIVGGDVTLDGGNGKDVLLWLDVVCDGILSIDDFETIV